MTHENEVWQIFDTNGEPVVEEGWDSALGNPEITGSDTIVGVAIVFLYRYNNGELEFLWQKRAGKVDNYSGFYDFSAGGHINFEETAAEAAIREAEEEIGAKFDTRDLEFVFAKSFNKNRFAWVYLVNWTGKEENFSFDDGEVSKVKWVPYSGMEAFRKQYAKPPIAKGDSTFEDLRDWLKMHEMI